MRELVNNPEDKLGVKRVFSEKDEMGDLEVCSCQRIKKVRLMWVMAVFLLSYRGFPTWPYICLDGKIENVKKVYWFYLL